VSYDQATAERVRRVLAGRPGVVEKRMVGGMSFSLGARMCCGVTGSALMVRVGREAREWALGQPTVRPIEMAGRALAGFVLVDPEGFATDAALATWVQRGVDFAATLAPKQRSPEARS
jgi:hypothetical protein